MGAVAKSYMRKGFLIYDEMCKYLVINEEDVSHIRLCNRSLVEFLRYEKMLFSFLSVKVADNCDKEYDPLHKNIEP